MNILTINVIGIPSGSSNNLIDAHVFQDYDAVVVNPESLERLYERFFHSQRVYVNPDENELTSKAGSLVSVMNERRRDEVNGLLQRGGVVVCFMQPIRRSFYSWRYEGEDRYIDITNYDWLLESMAELQIEYSTGTTIDYIDSGHPFTDYLKTKPKWSAYVEKGNCKKWKILASAFESHALSLTKRVGLGHIVLLPSDYDYRNGELLEKCIQTLLGDKKVTPQPSWAKDILVPGQKELISKINTVNTQISVLEKERETAIEGKQKLECWKYLLYEKGKHQLEPVVREALAVLGCNIEPQPDKESDGIAACDYGTALLEVVGSKNTIKIEKLGELIKNIGDYISQKGGQPKGILIGNPFCEESLDNRLPKDSQKPLFAKELIESAENQGITVLLTTDIYEIVSLILKGGLAGKEKQRLSERIFKGKGLVRLA